MEVNNTFSAETKNTSLSLPPRVSEDIAHLILVVIPSVLFSSLLLYCLYKLKKVFVVRPLLFLYGCIAVICIIWPISYGTASFVYDLHEPTDECSLLSVIIDFMFVVGQTALCFSIGMIVVVQFLTLNVKWKNAMTVKKVAVAYLSLLVVVLGANAVFFASICEQEREDPTFANIIQISIAAWTLVSFLIPLLTTILSSILIYVKVKISVLRENKKILNTIVLVSTFNVLSYACLRILALLLYMVSSTTNSGDGITEWYLKVIAVIIGNISYPLTIFSIFVVNSKIRRMLFCRVITDASDSNITATTTRPS